MVDDDAQYPFPDMKEFAAELKECAAKMNIAPTYFGVLAMGDSKLIQRLENGGDVGTRTFKKLRKFMKKLLAERRPPPR